jgi:hypothetical protein
MDNPVALATLGKQNTKQNKTQQMKLEKKDQHHGPDQKLGV